MRRVQSLELNSNSYSSFSHPNNKKVSLPPIAETNFAPKSSAGWLHRSVPNIHAARNTIVPMPIISEDIDDYFGSTMQSMSLAFFTFAYTELIDDVIFIEHGMFIYALLKFITIVCLGMTLIAAFSSIRVFLFACQTSDNQHRNKQSKFYSTIARFGAMIAAIICAIIIGIFAAISLYVTFFDRTME